MPGPIERVWSYLVDPELRGKWLASGDTDARVGGRLVLHFEHRNLSPHTDEPPVQYADHHEGRGEDSVCTITACEPPRLLTFTWPEGDKGESEVTFTLAPAGDKVRFVITHRRLSGPEMMSDVGSGWHVHTDILADVLAARAPAPFWSAWAKAKAAYVKRLGQD